MSPPDTPTTARRAAPSLLELQRQFSAGVYEASSAILAHLRDGAFTAERHLQVYRNNTFANLTDALAAVYPVVQRLVGESFFRYAADSYIREQPPRSGNLHDFGGGLAAFLASFPPAQSLAYLPDVARLEWAWHEAFHAAEAVSTVLADLQRIAPEDYGALVFRAHPSARLVESSYPILRIWQVNQPEHAGDASVDLDAGGDRLLVVRRDAQVEIAALSPGDHALLAALVAGRCLADAQAAAIALDSAFDLGRALQLHIGAGALVRAERQQ